MLPQPLCCVLVVTALCPGTTYTQQIFGNSSVGNALGLSCAYLGDSDRADTGLATVGEVTDDLYGV